MYQNDDVFFGEWKLAAAFVARRPNGEVYSWTVAVQRLDGLALAGWVHSLADAEIQGIYELFTSRDALQNLRDALVRAASEHQ